MGVILREQRDDNLCQVVVTNLNLFRAWLASGLKLDVTLGFNIGTHRVRFEEAYPTGALPGKTVDWVGSLRYQRRIYLGRPKPELDFDGLSVGPRIEL